MATPKLSRPHMIRARRRLRLLRAHLQRVTTEELVRSAEVTRGRLDYPGAEIFIRLGSREEFHRLHSCRKEPWTVQWIEDSLQPGDVFFDVGANVGAYSLIAAAVEPEARVVAFEPLPANVAALSENLALNGFGDRVTVVPVALGDRPGFAGAEDLAASPGTAPALAFGDAGKSVLVDRLDDLLKRYGLPQPNLIKLDADGHEQAIVGGADETLADRGLRSIMTELDAATEAALTAALAAHGFDLAERASGIDRMPGTPSYGLFLRR